MTTTTTRVRPEVEIIEVRLPMPVAETIRSIGRELRKDPSTMTRDLVLRGLADLDREMAREGARINELPPARGGRGRR